MYFNKNKQNRLLDKHLSNFMRASSAIVILTALSGCAINRPFISDNNTQNVKVEHKLEPEYAYKICYNTDSCIDSYDVNFKYCNPFNIIGAKSTLNYELDIKFKDNVYGRLLLPFENKKNVFMKLYFSEINIVTHTNRIFEIKIPHIKNNDNVKESIVANGSGMKININDITLGWTENYNLSSFPYSKTTYAANLDKLETGMQIILYLYKYPSTLSLSSNIKCILDKSNRYNMQLSLNKVNDGNLINIISSNYRLNPVKCSYFFGNYILSLEDNGFSILKLARRKAF